MIRAAVVAVVVLTTACSSEADKAQQEHNFLRDNNGTPRELCKAATKFVEAAVAERNAAQLSYARAAQSADCTSVDVFPDYADIPGGAPGATDEEIANALAAPNATVAERR